MKTVPALRRPATVASLPTTKLQNALSLIPRNRLAIGLRDNEQLIIHDVKGDRLTLRLAYRLITRSLGCTGAIPAFDRLPARLRGRAGRFRWMRLTASQYKRLSGEIEHLLFDAAQMFVALRPLPPKVAQQIDLEERVEFYRRQNAIIERRYGINPEVDHSAPVVQAVRCVELGVTFPSAGKAAKFLTVAMGRKVQRSDIRTALRRGYTCGTWYGPLPIGGDPSTWRSLPPGQGAALKLSWRYAADRQEVGLVRMAA